MNSIRFEVCIEESRLNSADLRNLLSEVSVPECLQVSPRARIQILHGTAEVKPHLKYGAVLELGVIRSQGSQKSHKVRVPFVRYSMNMRQLVSQYKRKAEGRN